MGSSESCTHYDYIIAGAGASGLSLLVRMISSNKFSGKTILLVDKEQKNKNDRTWCFWEKGKGFFESLVYKRWTALRFFSRQVSLEFGITPYEYKMIRGIDFYQYCINLIHQQKNITVRYGTIQEMHNTLQSTWIVMENETITAGMIFNSIIFSPPHLKEHEYYLLQHFKGWIIQTPYPPFDKNIATLMDFRIPQHHGTAFVYTMPLSSGTALVEYTLFSKDLLKPYQYDEGLRHYILTYLGCSEYTVLTEESGIIPMTNYSFPVKEGNIFNIGTAGGQTKGSSGYTFQFIQKYTSCIVEQLSKQTGDLILPPVQKRFHFYDSVLLNVLATGKMPGDEVFSHLFVNNPPHRIFQFLDNESSLLQDIKLINTLPKLPFFKAGIEQMF